MKSTQILLVSKHMAKSVRRAVLCTAVMALLSALPSQQLHAQQTFELEDGQFRKIAEPDPDTPEGELTFLEKKLAEGFTEEVICCLDLWIEQNPWSDLLPRAYILRGDAKVMEDDLYLALFDYEHVARYYPSSNLYKTAMQRQLEIAKVFANGRRRKAEFWKYTGIFYFLSEIPLFESNEEAEEIMIRIQERVPGSVLAEQAGKELADFYYRRGDMNKAAIAYELFQSNYPASEYIEYAIQRQIESNLATFKGPAFDATGLFEARNRLQVFQSAFPASANRSGANELQIRIEEALAEKLLFNAQWYDSREDYVASRFTYYRVVERYPLSVAAQQAYRRLRVLDPRLSETALGILREHYDKIIENSAQLPAEINENIRGYESLIPMPAEENAIKPLKPDQVVQPTTAPSEAETAGDTP